MNDIILQIGKGIFYKNLPDEAIKKMAEDLTFDNPAYKQAVTHGKYVPHHVDSKIFFLKKVENQNIYWTPRGYIWYIRRWLKRNNYPVKIQDKTLLLPQIDLQFQGKLRDYQEETVNNIVNRYPIGVMEAATGAGKTVMGTAIIARRKQKTLIIVHTKELLYQWQGSIKKFLNYDCGIIGDSKFEVKDITVGIINTVRNNTKELVNKFGHIICDEVHRCPSITWTETLSEFPARYYLGLTATPFRKDGLGNAIFAHIGPKIHKVDKDKLHESGAILNPKIFLVSTDYRYGRFGDEFNANYSSIIKDLTVNEARNKLICNIVYDDLKKYNQNILVTSDRVAHCKKLADMLRKMNVNCHVLSGQVVNGERKEIVKDVRNGKCKVLIATLSLIGEGFDAPNLTALFLTTPIKFSGRLIQTIGRIRRPVKGKTPRVYDFRDDNVRILRNMGFHRNKVYKKEF